MADDDYVEKKPLDGEPYTDQEDRRERALALAVQHHGLANNAPGMIPAKVETVLATTDLFAKYLRGVPIPELTKQAQDLAQQARNRPVTGPRPTRR